MKKILIITSLCGLSVACAETNHLPPIVNKSTNANGTPYSDTSQSNKPMYELLSRIESLQADVQQLRGQVEQQAHEIDSFKKRQKNIYADIDQRLQQLESGNIHKTNLPQQQYRPAPQVENKVKAPVKQVQAPTPAQIPVPAPVQSPESKANEKAAFNKAFESVKNSQYQQAIQLFTQFLQKYPTGDYSDNATFWLASVYKVVDDLPQAKSTFQAVFIQFPQSEKAGLAMLKLADIYLEENDQIRAKQLYTQVTTQYANTTAAHMATNKLKNIGP